VVIGSGYRILSSQDWIVRAFPRQPGCRNSHYNCRLYPAHSR
jgi:hypothetical protein